MENASKASEMALKNLINSGDGLYKDCLSQGSAIRAVSKEQAISPEMKLFDGFEIWTNSTPKKSYRIIKEISSVAYSKSQNNLAQQEQIKYLSDQETIKNALTAAKEFNASGVIINKKFIHQNIPGYTPKEITSSLELFKYN